MSLGLLVTISALSLDWLMTEESSTRVTIVGRIGLIVLTCPGAYLVIISAIEPVRFIDFYAVSCCNLSRSREVWLVVCLATGFIICSFR